MQIAKDTAHHAKTRALVRHPLSAAFPNLPETDLVALGEDIRIHGLKEAVVLHEGMVLDGWHRYRACQLVGVEMRTRDYQGDDPVGYVISKNAHRRHLTASQRAAAVVRCHDWAQCGDNQHTDPGITDQQSTSEELAQSLLGGSEVTSYPPKTEQQMADLAGVTSRTIRDAKVAEKAGLGDQVVAGELSAEKAAAQARGTPRDKKPGKVERLEAALAEARTRIVELEASIEHLTDEINLQVLAESDKTEQIKEIDRLQRYVRTLESQCREHQESANRWKRQAKALKRGRG